MTTFPTVPLPGETYDEATVIASVWIDDEAEPPIAMLLLLRKEPPYYRTQDVQFIVGAWENLHHTARDFPNIVPAVEHYQQNGGDY